MKGTDIAEPMAAPRGDSGPIRRRQLSSSRSIFTSQSRSRPSHNHAKLPYERRYTDHQQINRGNPADNSLLGIVSNKLMQPIRRIFSSRLHASHEDNHTVLPRRVTLDMEEGRLGDKEKETDSFASLRAKRLAQETQEQMQEQYQQINQRRNSGSNVISEESTPVLSQQLRDSNPIRWKSNDAVSIIEAYREALALQAALESKRGGSSELKRKATKSPSPAPSISPDKTAERHTKPTKKSRLFNAEHSFNKRINELNVYRQIRRGPSRLPHPSGSNRTHNHRPRHALENSLLSNPNDRQSEFVSINDIKNTHANIISIERVAKPLLRLEDIPQDRINRPGIFSAELDYSSDDNDDSQDKKVVSNDEDSLNHNKIVSNKDTVSHFKPTAGDVPFLFNTVSINKPKVEDVSALFKRPTEENPAAVNKRNLAAPSSVLDSIAETTSQPQLLNSSNVPALSPLSSSPAKLKQSAFMAPSAGFKIFSSTEKKVNEDTSKTQIQNQPIPLSTEPVVKVTNPIEVKPFSFGSTKTDKIAKSAEVSKPFSFGSIKPDEVAKPSEASKIFSFSSTKTDEAKPIEINKPALVSGLFGASTPKSFSFGDTAAKINTGASSSAEKEVSSSLVAASTKSTKPNVFSFGSVTKPSSAKTPSTLTSVDEPSLEPSTTALVPASASESISKSPSISPKPLFSFGSVATPFSEESKPSKEPLSHLGGTPKSGVFSFGNKPADSTSDAASNTTDAAKPFSFSLGAAKSDYVPSITSSTGLPTFKFGATKETDDEQKKKQKRCMSKDESAPSTKTGSISGTTTATNTASASAAPFSFSLSGGSTNGTNSAQLGSATTPTTNSTSTTSDSFKGGFNFGATSKPVVSVATPTTITPTTVSPKPATFSFGSTSSAPTTAKPLFGASALAPVVAPVTSVTGSSSTTISSSAPSSLGFGSLAKPAFAFNSNTTTLSGANTPTLGTDTHKDGLGSTAPGNTNPGFSFGSSTNLSSGFNFGSNSGVNSSRSGTATPTTMTVAETTAPDINSFGFGANSGAAAPTLNVPDLNNNSSSMFAFGASAKPLGMSSGSGSISSPNMFGMSSVGSTGTAANSLSAPNSNTIPPSFNFGSSSNNTFVQSSQQPAVASPGFPGLSSTPSFAFGAPAQQAPPPAAVFGFGQTTNNNPSNGMVLNNGMGMGMGQPQQQQQTPNMFSQGAPASNGGPPGRRMAPMRGRLRRR
ncbi:hypothetical protein NADFUDRAFT_78881 [Nadsonia fulvescens var. elongata DSM 6958]|uniref:Uncharacterized protein n=1 Tax=Nadsonia fulvescens var. elongata DSM 6958 TaxID=857566 RepID=A0A1E3PHU1_9ASCO|nr:hypothetical protein NADFUDRAFT_78881 [Nadsonia fulvescens var. elongata DSM 6958]